MANVLLSNVLSQKVSGSAASPQPRTNENDDGKELKQLSPSSSSPSLSGSKELLYKACLAQLQTGRSSQNGNKLFYADSVGFHVVDNTTVGASPSSSSGIGPIAPICDIPVAPGGDSRGADWVRIRSIKIRGCVRLISTSLAAATAALMPTVKIAIVKDKMPLLTNFGTAAVIMRTFAPNANPGVPQDIQSIWVIGNGGWTVGQYPIQLCIGNKTVYPRYEIMAERLIDDWVIPISNVQSGTGVNLGSAYPQKNFEMHIHHKGQGELMQWYSDVAGSNTWEQVNHRYFICIMTDNAPSPPEPIDVTWGWSAETVFDDTPTE